MNRKQGGIKNMDIQHMKRYLTGNQGKANKKDNEISCPSDQQKIF